MKVLILASSSPARKKLLEKCQYPFTCHSPDIDESPLDGEDIHTLTKRLSQEKALKIAKLYPTAVVIGSDQLAHLGGTLFGKPHNHQQATLQLEQMSGQSITFSTAVTVLSNGGEKSDTTLVETVTDFRHLSDKDIEDYLLKDKPYHCAGSFRSESLGLTLLTRCESTDPSALVGLPLITTCQLLRKHGVSV